VTAPEPGGADAEPAAERPPRFDPRRLDPRRAGPALRAFDLPAWFLLLGSVFGAFLVFFVPPSQGLDEPNHFYRVYSISQGQIVTPIPHDRAGVVVPACAYEFVYFEYFNAPHPVNYYLGDFWRTPAGCQRMPGQFVPIENTAVNSPVSYLPAVVAVTVLRVAGAPIPVVFFAGRLAGLAVYLALIYLAIRIAPRGKAVLFVLGALPTTLALASGYSADGMTIGLALLSIALALRLLLDDSTDRRWFVALAASLALLAVTKNTYFVLAPLILLVPAARISPSRRTALLAKGAALAVAAALAAAWYLAVRDVSLAAYAPTGQLISPQFQIGFVAHHPIAYIQVLGRSLFQAGPQSFFVPGFVQALGNFRDSARGYALAPIGLIVVATLVLAAAFRSELGPRLRPASRVEWGRALLPVVLAVASVVVILTVLWWQWTPIGSLTVRQVQGRYFVPLVPLSLITIALLRGKPDVPARWTWVVIGTLFMLLYTALKVGVLFY
jgi:hypothetical protein